MSFSVCAAAGVLCGDCSQGSGFSALLGTCVSCDASHAVLILALVIADVVIVLAVLALMVPSPSWVYPVLFYLQFLPHLAEHFPVTFEKLRPYAVYIGSALGLYFPYDFCLHSAMNAGGVYSLRYIPALVVVSLAPLILHVRLKKFRPCDWHGLWWLVLTLYTPLLHTSFSLLDCPSLDDEGGAFTPRWYVNANIRCFQDAAHAPLGLFAIFVVCFCASLIPFVVLVVTKRLSRPYWLHCLVTPLAHPYKPKYEWWCGVELAKRFILVLLAIAVKPNDFAVLFVLVVMVTLNGFFKPYKHMLVNVLDTVFAVDIFVLLALRNTVDAEDLLHSIPEQDDAALGGGCGDVQGVSPFVIFLSVFYYFPFLLALIAGGVWGVWHLYHLVKNGSVPAMKQKDLKREPSSILSPSPLPSRPRTQTVVDLADMGGEDTAHQRKGSRFRWGSRKRKNLAKSDSSKSSGGGAMGVEEVVGIPLKTKGVAAAASGGLLSPLITSAEGGAAHKNNSTENLIKTTEV